MKTAGKNSSSVLRKVKKRTENHFFDQNRTVCLAVLGHRFENPILNVVGYSQPSPKNVCAENLVSLAVANIEKSSLCSRASIGPLNRRCGGCLLQRLPCLGPMSTVFVEKLTKTYGTTRGAKRQFFRQILRRCSDTLAAKWEYIPAHYRNSCWLVHR